MECTDWPTVIGLCKYSKHLHNESNTDLFHLVLEYNSQYSIQFLTRSHYSKIRIQSNPLLVTSLYSKYCFIWNFFRSLPKRMHFKPLYSYEELDPLGAKWWVEATLLRMQCRINTANELVSCSRRTSPKSTKPTTDDRLVTGTKRVLRAPSYFVHSKQKLSNSMVQCARTVHLSQLHHWCPPW